MKTLVIGLGNPVLGDDGVGWRVAEAVAAHRELRAETEVDSVSLRGLSLMERLTGYERAILVDAIVTGQKAVGAIWQFSLPDLPEPGTANPEASLRNALNIGRSMGIPLPQDEQVTIVAIEVENAYDFSGELSPAVETAIPQAVEAVLDLIQK